MEDSAVICPACGKNVVPPGPPVRLEEIKTAIERLGAKDRSMLRPWLLAKFDVQGQPQRRMHTEVQQAQQQFVDAIVAESGPLDEARVSELERLFNGDQPEAKS